MYYLKYAPYLYIILGIIFILEGITKWNNAEANPKTSIFIGILAIAMFLFRIKFAKKLEDQNNKF